MLIYSGLHITVALGLVSFLGVLVPARQFRHRLQYAVAVDCQHGVQRGVRRRAAVRADGVHRQRRRARQGDLRRRQLRCSTGCAAGSASRPWRRMPSSPRSPARPSPRPRCSPGSPCPRCAAFGYTARFTVGVVAGSSVLGMLIPPSAMLIIYAIVTEQSVGADVHRRHPAGHPAGGRLLRSRSCSWRRLCPRLGRRPVDQPAGEEACAVSDLGGARSASSAHRAAGAGGARRHLWRHHHLSTEAGAGRLAVALLMRWPSGA